MIKVESHDHFDVDELLKSDSEDEIDFKENLENDELFGFDVKSNSVKPSSNTLLKLCAIETLMNKNK